MTARLAARRRRGLLSAMLAATLVLTAESALAAAPVSAAPEGAPPAAARLATAFDTAAGRYDVPRDLLVALGYAETRLDGHGGAPSAAGGYGMMHLVSNPKLRTLDEAATLTGLSRAALRADAAANIAGAAAVLRSYADQAGLSAAGRDDVDEWYAAVARYGGAASPALARVYADAVYDLLGTGFETGHPGVAKVPGRQVAPDRDLPGGESDGPGILSTDYGPAAWAPASTSNYTVASRPTSHSVRYIVIHVTQGSYAGSISWFQNPAAQASAHYTFRSSDGAVTQSVREKDIAWHAGNWTYNTQSIGIEHEGYVDNAAWFTDAMYRASATLTRSLANKYGIPKTRTHIIGHHEVPGATHTDPGPNWNWSYYMQLVNQQTGVGSGTVNTEGVSLNVRSGPGTGYAVVGSVADGATVSIYCQAVGTTVTGPYGTSNVWDRIGTNRYVSDAYVLTGHDGFIPGVPRC
ncbi:N-acetylmuramoyl-L-alanine amidase [Micromonospora sp. DSM 115977]|uniref:N-acetylmuramoyl-L-alanine amidase n=1 Tax=Micromonospora reichwaldensis TaxID=3075516 RepID=A0ABU2WR22_9ACTN|nr:N-acetylmuramoyl-L-alanine amidase [Micromonospora sp. DSM 115977]MDT0528020.1 N-acetylmuramoyl-L-alanine amidase [Micromonospora sp. DSM 115977]